MLRKIKLSDVLRAIREGYWGMSDTVWRARAGERHGLHVRRDYRLDRSGLHRDLRVSRGAKGPTLRR